MIKNICTDLDDLLLYGKHFKLIYFNSYLFICLNVLLPVIEYAIFNANHCNKKLLF